MPDKKSQDNIGKNIIKLTGSMVAEWAMGNDPID